MWEGSRDRNRSYDAIWHADEDEPADPDAAGSELAPLEEEAAIAGPSVERG